MRRFFRWIQFNWLYLGKPRWDTGTTPPELKAFIAAHPPGRALDLGCGTGTNLLALAQAGWQVTGIDFALRAVNQARGRLAAAGCASSVLFGDASRMEGIRGPFELVLDIGCFHGLVRETRPRYVENLLRVLGAEGRFLIYCHLTEAEDAAVGFHRHDLDLLQSGLVCLARENSSDRWGRSAAWMTFGRRGHTGAGP